MRRLRWLNTPQRITGTFTPRQVQALYFLLEDMTGHRWTGNANNAYLPDRPALEQAAKKFTKMFGEIWVTDDECTDPGDPP